MTTIALQPCDSRAFEAKGWDLRRNVVEVVGRWMWRVGGGGKLTCRGGDLSASTGRAHFTRLQSAILQEMG